MADSAADDDLYWEDPKPEGDCTDAYYTFGENLGRLNTLLDLRDTRSRQVTLELAMINRMIQELPGSGPSRDSQLPGLLSERERFGKQLRSVVRANALVNEWHIVMVVTFLETYLEDVLANTAGVDPSHMAKSEQAVNYADAVEANSLDELRSEIRRRWANNVVRNGSPAAWVQRLRGWGASQLRDDHVEHLDQIIGARHVVVHAAGRVTREFVRRYPSSNRKVGQQIDITTEELMQLTNSVLDFVAVTDKFLCKRYAVLIRAEPSQADKPTPPVA